MKGGGSTTTDVYGYPATSNRLVQITRHAGGMLSAWRATTVRSLAYDNAGNLTSDSGAGGSHTYVYNNRNRLSQATIGAVVWSYTSNGLEQLAVRTRVSPAATTHFIHDLAGNVIAETNGTAAGTVREYIHLPETEIAPTAGARTQVDRPLAVVDNINTATPVTYTVHVDHLNRPVRMTNAAKAAVWDAVFLPWGGVHSIAGTATLDARFPGQWFQLETGLHYNWHRQYDPTIGRYTQPDPLGFVDGPSVYGYVGGDPQGFVDLDGLARYRSRPSAGRPATMNFPRGGSPGSGRSEPRTCSPENPHGHHSFPMFMGGPRNQQLTQMPPSTHRELHRDLYSHLSQYRDAYGNSMMPHRGNPGSEIQRNFTEAQRQEAMRDFHRSHPQYSEPARDFNRQFPR